MEYGWGGRAIDKDNWTPSKVTDGPSAWGHDRSWLSEQDKQVAKRIRTPQKGVRNPVPVLPDPTSRSRKAKT